MTEKSAVIAPWEKLGIQTVPISHVPVILDIAWGMEKKLTVCLIGDTGIGKTPLVHQWCKNKGGFMRPLNFGHMSQEEISMAMFSADASYHDFVPPKFLLELNEEAEKRGCAVLFLDEWNRGDKALVNALFTLTDERRVHNFTLHKNVLVVAAMNPSDGSYLVNEAERDHAIRKRLNFVYTTAEIGAWMRFAKNAGYDNRVIRYLQAAPGAFYDKGARDAGKCFPCPSNWEKVSDILHSAERLCETRNAQRARDEQITLLNLPGFDAMVFGQIGDTHGEKFFDFLRDESTVIQPGEILFGYRNSDITNARSARRRVASLLGCDIRNGRFVRKDNSEVRADVITNLNSMIALTLFSTMPDPKTIAPDLGAYLIDLTDEYFMQFIAGALGEQYKAHESMTGVREYRRAYNIALAAIPGLQEKNKVLMEKQRKMNLEIEAAAAQDAQLAAEEA